MNQMELNAEPRKRVQLVADEPAANDVGEAGSGDGFVDAMLASNSTTELAHAMKRAVSAFGKKSVSREVVESEGPELSEWFEGDPPQTGWWDVKLGGKLAHFDDDRLWFNTERQRWGIDPLEIIIVNYLKGAAYRGLKQPPEGGYPWLKPANRRVILVV